MAHYELRAAAKFAAGSTEPFYAAVGGLAGMSVDKVSGMARERLTRMSEFLGSGLTKTALRPIRALLGKHT
ncbi:hypothetical protein WMF31_20790 [Sorangium sp. So ce1036]|uniref:hypothetical protein n=1 Tax=Sorangium sp. So ce1036 TaxID=3133328 RepID=UPI003F09198A